MTSTPLYSLENITMQYGKRTVLNIGQLQVHPGELLTIVGPSGAGKSTLLRLLGLLEAPTNGTCTLHLDGTDYDHRTAPIDIRRQIAMVFQNPHLLSRRVRANVAYSLRVRGNRNGTVRINDMLERVAMLKLQNAHPQQLSGGELQRVALARALIIEPNILLLDEPTANLDPYNVRLIEDLLQEQRQQHQTTVILITHNIFQAKRLADRVAFLFEGELIEVASSDVFFNNPQHPRTAAFVSGDLVY